MVSTDIHGNKYNRTLLMTVLITGSFVTILTATLLATAYPSMMKTFNIDASTVQWLTTGFTLVNGIMIPVSAYLINKLSTKFMYISALIIYLLGTMLAYWSPNFQVLLAGRLVQAIGAGVSMPLMQSIVLMIYPPEKRGAAMGTMGLAIGMAPAIGPTLSGYIVDHFTWRDLFGMIIPIISVVIIAAFFLMKDVLPNTSPKLDFWSVVTSIAGFGIMLYGFAEVGSKGWDDTTVIASLVIGAAIVALFAVRQFKLEEPFLNLNVFKTGQYTLGTIISSLSYMGMLAAEMILPLYIQNVLGKSALQSGLILLPGAIAMGVMSPITGRLFDKYGAKHMVITGAVMLIFGTSAFLFIGPNTPTIYITAFYAVRMFGVAMMMPVTTAGMNALPLNLMTHGTAVNNTVRQVAGSIGTAILTSVLTNVANSNTPAKSLLTQNPLAYKDKAIDAVILGYKAAFMVAIVFAVLLIFAALFLRKGNIAKKEEITNGKEAR
ncbi:MDR family MFS transporter [Lactobacillus jensenii]|uniref:MDR family MFS transporter n=1 Tax=Lactobacillus jensenii TaxID=109790 RepID=UPI0001B96109|nr:MDR family MFS transporter [Lactobacillus jensenii]EEX27262.1 drug resistance MFS transporter, drug:H+ antiporter-2 family [Lactobacillus jensenii SJ-7A-US]MCF1851378.1 multidrug efflux MFS transporter [Lactobacillus jensenii]MCW8071662.1 multidrug efflux MFS transporter [Lactobacillus jensenii]MCZ3724374.1 multidrug efflux MFS transporter [Lactobacillus jensenii]MCZ3725893.1 multidrug efflux MFS transporter [Lactobacillus jensenii]